MVRKIRGVPYLQLQDEHGNTIRKEARGNALDEFLKKMDDPTYWLTIPGGQELQPDLVLSPEEISIIQRIENNQYGDSSYDPYEPLNEFFTKDIMQTPLTGVPEPKRRFIPSKWEYKRVMKIVTAIRKGLITVDDLDPTEKKKKPKIYDIWESTESDQDLASLRISAPKVPLPGHSESYNPPTSYLPSQKEIDAFQNGNKEEREFLPQKYLAFRNIPGYGRFVQERFSRCLDLYLCPRALRKRSVIDPESLIPHLPDIEELRPFPTKVAIEFNGHTDRVTCISTIHTGNWLLSGSEDCSLRLWDVESGRCFTKWQFDSSISNVAWNPNPSHCIMSFSVGNSLFFKSLDVLGAEVSTFSKEFLFNEQDLEESSSCRWKYSANSAIKDCLEIIHPHPIIQINWHRKGDYLSVVCGNPSQSWLFIHQLSKHRTQSPFRKSTCNDPIKQTIFHSSKPQLYIASERTIRLFDLVNSENPLVKKVATRSLTVFDVHPRSPGGHLLVGTRDNRTMWYDLEMSCIDPYRTMRYHRAPLKAVRYHPKFPFFATGGDDGTVQLFHCNVYENDLLKKPLIVPLHVVKVCKPVGSSGVLAVDFHPEQPWMFVASADHSLKLYT